MNISMEIKKYHNKILKYMKTFGVTMYHILIHFIGSKLGLYFSFRIPLYQGILKATVSGVFEDLKFKISEGSDQN